MALQGKSNVSIVEPATLDLAPVKPKPLLNIALAILAGALAGIALAFVAESLEESQSPPANTGDDFDLPATSSARRAEVIGVR